jgi:2-haloalkanoic acid dehalogenase type II
MRITKKEEVDVVSFDCYGTLIDWEQGIREAFEQALVKDKEEPTVHWTRILDYYDQEERRIQKLPYRTYREVLAQAVYGVAKRIGWNLTDTQGYFLANSLPRWKPFPETNAALERISENHELGILSNVDNDLLAGTLVHFTVPFDIIVTAEDVKSYKPDIKHFEVAKKKIGKNKKWLHVAGSLYHDVEPALKLGIPVVWVNRKGVPATISYAEQPVKIVHNLTEVADWLDSLR